MTFLRIKKLKTCPKCNNQNAYLRDAMLPPAERHLEKDKIVVYVNYIWGECKECGHEWSEPEEKVYDTDIC